jgi:O-antigen ligase
VNEAGESRFAAWRNDWPAAVAAGLIVCAVALAGGGAESPFRSGLVEGAAAMLLTAMAASHFTGRPLPPEAAVPLWLTAAVLALIALQLVPLPPGVWTGLPGRDTELAIARLSGDANSWKPLSLDPEATRRTAAALLLPVAVMLACLGSTVRGRKLITRAIIAGALLSALLGGIQVAMGTPERWTLYGGPVPGSAPGLFANSNHQAMLMLSAIIATGLVIRMEKPQIRVKAQRGPIEFHLGWLLFPIFIAMTIAAGSRAGVLLLVPALALGVLVAAARKGAARWLARAAVVTAAALTIFLIWPGSTRILMEIQSAMMGDGRFVNLPDAVYTFRQYSPWGSGFGTFMPVFQANENLDLITMSMVNHVHNEPLELLIEAGFAGAILAATIAAALFWRLWQLARNPARTGAPAAALAGFGIIGLLLVHSLIDYPLRNDALAAIAGLAIGFIAAPRTPDQDERTSANRRRGRRGFGSGLPPQPGRSRGTAER